MRGIQHELAEGEQVDVDRPRPARDDPSPAHFAFDRGEFRVQPVGGEPGPPATAHIEEIGLRDPADGFGAIDVRDGVDSHHGVDALQCGTELEHGLTLVGPETE